MTLTELADKYGTDKGNAFHLYTNRYAELLEPRREAVRRVLEIGVLDGASLRMWRDYFPNAEVRGVDHLPSNLFDEDRIRTFWAQQTKPGGIIWAAGPWPYDLIVDDGSHRRAHQESSLRALAPLLADDGLYFVEDAEVEGFAEAPPELPGFRHWTIEAEKSAGRTVVYGRA